MTEAKSTRFQSRCWLELRCNPHAAADAGRAHEFQSRCWLELRCNVVDESLCEAEEVFQSRCWLELRCNSSGAMLSSCAGLVSEQMLA